MKTDLAGVGEEWRMRARDKGGVEMVGGDGNEMGLMMKKGKRKSMTGIGASLTPDYRDKKESNNNINGWDVGYWTNK